MNTSGHPWGGGNRGSVAGACGFQGNSKEDGPVWFSDTLCLYSWIRGVSFSGQQRGSVRVWGTLSRKWASTCASRHPTPMAAA